MSKKTLKILLAVFGAVAIIATVIYFIINKKNKNAISQEEENFEPEEEHLDAADALDLSSLKFSRHYVDLR